VCCTIFPTQLLGKTLRFGHQLLRYFLRDTGAGGSNLGGTLWELTSGGTFSVLHAFSNSTDGEDPKSLIMDSRETSTGPQALGCEPWGTLWKRTSGGTFSVLHSFSNSSDGEESWRLAHGFIRELLRHNGVRRRQLRGNVVELTSSGTFSVLHAFSNSTDGEEPKQLGHRFFGKFYGTSGAGGANSGETLWSGPPGVLSACYTPF